MKYEGKRVIGITGGIGAGKTMALNIFKTEFDALIIEADHVGHIVMEPGGVAYKPILDAFGDEIVNSFDKTIDRKALGEIVFSDRDKLQLLNSITHPLIYSEIDKLIRNSNNKLIILEAALLTETTLKNMCDEIWYIYADEDTRLERLSRYRGISIEKARCIISNQPCENEFRKHCQVEIDNSGDVDSTLKQIKKKILGGTI